MLEHGLIFGGFNPIHDGHVRLFATEKEVRKSCTLREYGEGLPHASKDIRKMYCQGLPIERFVPIPAMRIIKDYLEHFRS
jgi:hypothetical protein